MKKAPAGRFFCAFSVPAQGLLILLTCPVALRQATVPQGLAGAVYISHNENNSHLRRASLVSHRHINVCRLKGSVTSMALTDLCLSAITKNC